MSERTVVTAITPDEWDVVSRLRDIPEGRLRRQLMSLVAELVTFAAEPTCSEMQADGVPCPTVHASCDECQRIVACLARLRQLVGTSAGGMA
jgi:hypothetical protein